MKITPKPGQVVQMPAGKAKVSRVEGGRIYFHYIRNGKPSKVERNIWDGVPTECTAL